MLKFLLLSLISFTYSQEASCHSLNDWLSTQAARNQEAVQFLEYLYIKIQVGDDFVHVNSNDIVQLYDHEQYATQFQLIPHFNVEESASFRSRQQTPPVVDPTLTQYSFVKTFGKGSKGALKTKYLPWYKDAYRRSAVKFEKPAAGSDFQSEIIGGRYFIIPLSDGTGFNVRSVEKPDYSWTSSVAQLRKQIILKKGDGDTVLFNLTSRTFCTNYHDLATGNLIQLDSGQSDLISSRNFMNGSKQTIPNPITTKKISISLKPGDIYRYDKTRTAVKEVAVVDTKSSSVQDTFTRMFNPVIQIPLFGGFSAVSVTTLKQTITSDINAKTDRLQDTNTGHDFLEIKCPDFFSRSEQNKTFGDVCLKYEFVSKKLTQYVKWQVTGVFQLPSPYYNPYTKKIEHFIEKPINSGFSIVSMEYEDIFNVLDPNNRVAVVENDYSSTLKMQTYEPTQKDIMRLLKNQTSNQRNSLQNSTLSSLQTLQSQINQLQELHNSQISSLDPPSLKLAEAAEADTFAADVESSVQDLLNGKGYFESKLNEFYNNESFESINADKLDMLSVLDQRRQHEDSQLQVKIQELQKANDELDSMKRMLTILKSGKSDNRPDNKIEEIIVEDVEEEEVSEQYEFNDMLKTLLDAKSQISSSNDELRRETISTIESLAEKERVINQLRDKLTHLENLQNQFQSNKQVTFAEDTERILEENQLKQTDLDRKHEILRMLSGDDQEEEDLTEQYEDVVDEEEEGEVEELMTRLDNASVQEIAATSQTNETAAQEQDDIDNDSSVESQMKYLYDTREKINESINKLAVNLYEMEQFEPSSEEDRERLTIMKISLLKQFQELKGIRDQVLFYITSIETGEVGNIDDQVKSDPAIVATDDVKNVKNEESVIVIENSQAWVEDANVEELEQDEDVEQTGQVEESYEEEDSGAKQLFMENSGQIYSAAANMISKLEKEPYFLLQVFRGATKMTNSYQRQKFLMAIDAIVDQDVEEFNEEEEVVEGSDDAVKNNSSPRTALSFDQVSQASVALSTATIESSAWKNGFSEVSRGDNYSHVYQILREARLRISNTVDEFVSSVNNSRFTRLQIDQLVEKFLTVLVIGGENSSSWQETRRQLEFGLEKFVNRNISKQRDNLFYQVDEIATQVIFDQQKRRDDDEDSSDEDDELVFAKRPESFGGSLFLN